MACIITKFKYEWVINFNYADTYQESCIIVNRFGFRHLKKPNLGCQSERIHPGGQLSPD